MRLCVLGGTGGTGLQLVSQALDAGHQVVAIVRNPAKLKHIQHQNLTVVAKDLFSVTDVAADMAGCDAVLSCLGVPPSISAVKFYTDSARSITECMRQSGVNRLICLTSWYTQKQQDEPLMMRYFVRPLLLGRLLTSMGEMEAYMRTECQDIQYTIIRPPSLNNKHASGKEIIYEEEATMLKQAEQTMPRADVARAMLDSLSNKQHYQKILAIGLNK